MGKPGFPISQPLVEAAGTPTGRRMGKPGFPISQPLVEAAGAPTGRGMGKPGFPMPGRGMGKPGFPISQPLVGAAGTPTAGAWGNLVSPSPNRWWKRLAPPQAEVCGNPGSPYQAGGWGNPVSPYLRISVRRRTRRDPYTRTKADIITMSCRLPSRSIACRTSWPSTANPRRLKIAWPAVWAASISTETLVTPSSRALSTMA